MTTLVAVGLVGGLAGCGGDSTSSDEVHDFVTATTKLMDGGIIADTEEWRSARDAAVPELSAMASIPDTYPGLSKLAVLAGGNHSQLLTPDQVSALEAPYEDDQKFPKPTVRTSDGISVVTLPEFAGQSQQAIDEYQDAGIDAVRNASTQTSCGWIIDVSDNGGGNAYPMLSTIAPLLGDGMVMGFQGRDGDTKWLRVKDGNLQFAWDGVAPGVADFHVEQPVAIVTSRSTASSAEVVVVAFAGQQRTIRVGSPTRGLTTGNEVFHLSDGGLLALSTSRYVDRDNNVYNGPITPDLHAIPLDALDQARTWVNTNCN